MLIFLLASSIVGCKRDLGLYSRICLPTNNYPEESDSDDIPPRKEESDDPVSQEEKRLQIIW